jgi:sterol desaturase/sphingolipid hydroxylase (fatty acid hydroxylase superfamily)
MTGMPLWLAGLIAFVVLDFAVWLEHVISHKWPWLWRIHRMHHADTGFDLTTALRFHPLEILLSMLWKAAVIIALGATAGRSARSSRWCSTVQRCSTMPTSNCPRLIDAAVAAR